MKFYQILTSGSAWLLFLAGAGAVSSCNDKLDLFPEDQVTPATFYKNEKELRLATNQLYTEIVPYASSIY